ncbi:hypothetical protein ACIQAD_16035 [Streptomyces sp. NPDC088551]|uniref:hypothetical protein n=1 Tax=unclassified Streptomyces TaxID=2593676 RepID=UPI0010D9199D|nr:hypothetical protein [Streptomyces sp. L-9-10]RYJ31702.1 hypothetical protein CU044_0069 [Streptomyces sp. L-9-10]
MGGLLHEWTDGWFELWSLVARMSYFDGYEIYVSLVLIVAGLGMGAAAESAKKRGL